MKASIIIERILITLIIIGLGLGLYLFIKQIRLSAADIKIESNLRQMGKILETYKIESTDFNPVNGGCQPDVSSCLALSANSPIFSGAPESGNDFNKLVTEIVNSSKERVDKVYMKSEDVNWTVSTPVPTSLANGGTSTYCFSSEGYMKICTNYPSTETDSLCPDTGSFKDQTFTCKELEK